MSARGTLFLLILGLVLTACGGGDSNEASASDVKAGTCIAKEVDDEDDTAPDLSSVVTCSEPHVYEILDVVGVPDDALSGNTDKEMLANRKDLATLANQGEEQSDENAAFFEFAGPRCDQALRRHAGYDDITVKGKSAEEITLSPVLGAEVYTRWVNLMPEAQWLKGKRQFICSVRYVEESDDEEPPAGPVASPNEKMLIGRASSPSFPINLRECSDVDSEKNDAVTRVGCDQSHTSEGLFIFDGDVAFGEKMMAPINKANDPTDEQMAPLDRACTDSLAAVMAEGYDKKKVAGKAYRVEFEEGFFMVQCDLAAVDFRKNNLGPGSFAWTDAAKARLASVE